MSMSCGAPRRLAVTSDRVRMSRSGSGRHNAGHSKATRHGIPWAVVHTETVSNRAEAARRERYYKTGRGRDELDKLNL